MLTESAVAVETPAARPHYIAHGGRHLFAWHHPARPTVRRGRGGGSLPAAWLRLCRCLPCLADPRRAACRRRLRRVSLRLRGNRRLRRRPGRARSAGGLDRQHRTCRDRGAGASQARARLRSLACASARRWRFKPQSRGVVSIVSCCGVPSDRAEPTCASSRPSPVSVARTT